jgi:Domain of unknown function (DUF4136)
MNKIALVAVALFFLAAIAAAAQDVRYTFDNNAGFSKFRTYKWVPIKDAANSDAATAEDLLDKQIKDAVDAELAKKALTKTEAGTADLLVGYLAGSGTEIQFSSYNSGWGYGPGWSGGGWYRGGGGKTTGPNFYGIYAGQLALDMNDSRSHTLVWRGVASKTIDPKAKPDKAQKNLAKAVAKLLKNYPRQPPTAK